MMSMTRSAIRYRNLKVPWYYAWNPGGMGCSGGCPDCWARGIASRFNYKCEKCRNFEVHLHPERLDWPAKVRKPGVVLVNFTCDTWDAQREAWQVGTIQAHARQASRHTYVWLTKQVGRLAEHFERLDRSIYFRDDPNWYLGLSICDMKQAREKLPIFAEIPGKKWLSLEPLSEGMTLSPVIDKITGVIIGHNNRKGAPGTDNFRAISCIVRECALASIPVYVKQLWIDGKLTYDPEKYPEDLRERDLPWSMPEVKQ